jgi:hypothetical protein
LIYMFASKYRVIGTILILLGMVGLAAPRVCAQEEAPYFVAYSSALEEPGNLEIENQNTAAAPRKANGFFAPTVEFEYGTTAWWTSELYLQGQKTANDSAVFTGFRVENRFRPIPRELWVNPVLYVEYEDINGADKSLLEVVGNDSIGDLRDANAVLRAETERELETRLILSSQAKGWNFSENVIAEKMLNAADPWEFGYALGAARPLRLTASGRACTLCLRNVAAGAEMFGGLGTTAGYGLHATSHYAGPVLALTTPQGWTYRFGPEFGMNANSAGVLWKFGASYEIQQIRDWFRRSQ